jgi:hypothetical protein
LLATILAAGFGAGLAGAFVKALRAGGAAFAAPERFDFTAIFFGLDAALAMIAGNPREKGKLRALHHFGRFRASRETPFQR